MHVNSALLRISRALLVIAASSAVTAFAQSNRGISFQTIIVKPDGSAPTIAGASVNVKILSPNRCVLWEETHSGVNISDGYMTLAVGTGATFGAHPSGQTMKRVFNSSLTQTGLTCLNSTGGVASGVTSYVPTAQDALVLRVSLTIDSEPVVADFNMRSVGFAFNAENLGGKSADEFVQVKNGVTQSRLEDFFAAMTSASNGSVRWNGSSFESYSTTSGAVLANDSVAPEAIASIPWSKVTGIPAQLTQVGGLSCADGKIMKRVAGAWACADDDAGTAGTDSLAALSCANGDMPMYNGSSWTCLSASTSNANNAIVRRDGAGQIMSTSVNVGSLVLNNGGGSTITLSTPVGLSTYSLMLPASAGSNGQVLMNDGSGGLVWQTPNPAAITGLTGDVTTSGTSGSVGATVANVGGVTAANVAAGATLANAATSANTAGAIVKRDGSGGITVGGLISGLLQALGIRIGTQTDRTMASDRGQLSLSSTFVAIANSSTTVDWERGNIQEINTFACDGAKTISMSNLRDGGAYTILMTGSAAHSGNCLFSSSGYTFKMSGPAAPPAAGKDVLFTFAVINTTVIYTMMDNLQ